VKAQSVQSVMQTALYWKQRNKWRW